MAISYILGNEYNAGELCQLAHQVGWKDWEPELINKCYQGAYLVATGRLFSSYSAPRYPTYW